MSKGTNPAAILPALGGNLVIENRAIPSPEPDEVLIRNHAIAVNNLDWKRQQFGFYISSYPVVLGADISGVVSEVGSSVTAFKPGDRVMGLADSMLTGHIDHGAYQTYTIVKASSASLLPKSISFNQAATLPTGIASALITLIENFGLPRPTANTPPSAGSSAILIWGAASVTGLMAIQLVRLSGLTVFATASQKNHDYLRQLGASVVVDYKSSTAVDDLLAAAKRDGKDIVYALDCISSKDTLASVVQVVAKSSGSGKKIAHLVPWSKEVAVPEGVETKAVAGEQIWSSRVDLCEWLTQEKLPEWLENQTLLPAKYRVIKGGLGGLQDGLNELKQGGASAEKLVVEV